MGVRRRRRRRSELRVAQVVNQAILLAALWIIFSGKFDTFHLALGAVSVVLVLGFNDAIRRLRPGRGGPARRDRIHLLRAAIYLPWLLGQIVSSGFYVARLCLAPEGRVDPRIVRFRSDQPNEVASVTLGNSITLTPGTLTLDINDDEYVIHALDQGVADGVLGGAMQDRVARMWHGVGGVKEPSIDTGEGE
ncbi:MAG: Na+/H+ antiporter subunit E [Planctomycetota bacterium]|jgi:multicomponent Na+:H+ antiporter subunit E